MLLLLFLFLSLRFESLNIPSYWGLVIKEITKNNAQRGVCSVRALMSMHHSFKDSLARGRQQGSWTELWTLSTQGHHILSHCGLTNSPLRPNRVRQPLASQITRQIYNLSRRADVFLSFVPTNHVAGSGEL